MHTIFMSFMSAAGRHKTFMAPFHTLISCDIPFVLFRLDFERDMSHCILRRVSVRFVASEIFSLADASTSDNCFSTGSFYTSPVDSVCCINVLFRKSIQELTIYIYSNSDCTRLFQWSAIGLSGTTDKNSPLRLHVRETLTDDQNVSGQ